MVGEKGPELFIPKQSGTIMTAIDTAAAMRSNPSAYIAPAYYNNSVTSGPSTVNNFNSNVAADGLVADRIARNIAEQTVAKQRDMMAPYGIGGAP